MRSPFLPRAVRVDQPAGRHLASGGRARPVDQPAREERDTMLIDAIQARIDELYKLIMEHPVFLQLNEVQAEVNELMNAVNSTITFHITGEKPSCTGSCSTCGGGCH